MKLRHSSPSISTCPMRCFRTDPEYFISSLTRCFNFNSHGVLSPVSCYHSPSGTQFLDSKTGILDELEDRLPSTGGGAPPDCINPMKPNGHSHPWPEWLDLMKLLSKKGYLEEGQDGNLFQNGAMGVKEANRIRTACLNFTRDRFDLIRKDIEVVAGSGCPSTCRKVVNSSKRLRAHVDIHEGNVCSSCILRGSCDRAYLTAIEGEVGHTVDLMRVLLTYGLDPIANTVENVLCQSRTVEESTRRLLREMVEFGSREFDSLVANATSSKKAASMSESSSFAEKSRTNPPIREGDWLCPKCNFLNFARNVKCLRCDDICPERLRKQLEDQDHLPLKKGDWICNKCNFLNFARNTICFMCKEKPPRRELNPGDWECDSCNFINFRRNMVCLKCDHRRPKAMNSSEVSSQSGHKIHGFSHFYDRGSSFVRDEDETNGERPIKQEVQTRNDNATRWRFLEDDNDYLNARDEVSGFVDFPIAGGRSELSQDSKARLKWKSEMLKWSRHDARGVESSPANNIPRRPEFVECSGSDEEMDEWFGRRRRMQKEELDQIHIQKVSSVVWA